MVYFTGDVYSENLDGDLEPTSQVSSPPFGVNTQFFGTSNGIAPDFDVVYMDVAASGSKDRHPRAIAPLTEIEVSFTVYGATYYFFDISDASGRSLFRQALDTPLPAPQNITINTTLFVPNTNFIYFTFPTFGPSGGLVNYELRVEGEEEPLPTISFANSTASILEGDTGTRTLYLDVVLSEPSKTPVTVNYTTLAGSATTVDFEGSSGTLSFAPGKTTARIAVKVIGDFVGEGLEDFYIVLSSPANAELLGGGTTLNATAYIEDNDPETVTEQALEALSNVVEDIVSLAGSAAGMSVDISNFAHDNNRLDLIKSIDANAGWFVRAKSITNIAGAVGNVMTLVSSAKEAWEIYENQGASAGIAAGTKSLIVAMASGSAGSLAASGVATGVAFFTGATLAPVIVGFAAGFVVSTVAGEVVGLGVDYLLESKTPAPMVPNSVNVSFSAKAAAPANPDNSFGPFKIGAPPPVPQWQYNADTGAFTWLKKPNAATIARIETQLGFNDNPLKLKGDVDKLDKADVIFGGNGADTIDGVTADDAIFGKGGNDILVGGLGRDILVGGLGNDLLDGGLGEDLLDGGSGLDTANYGWAKMPLSVNLDGGYLEIGYAYFVVGGVTQPDIDTLDNVENVIGGAADDDLFGNAASNTLEGGLGNDQLYGNASGAAGDSVSYAGSKKGVVVDLAIQDGSTAQNTVGAGFDTLSGFENAIGSAAIDTLRGDGGNNRLYGLAGNDILSGGDGNDWLIGGIGADTLSGGGGIDIFYMNALAAAGDLITDFTPGQDRLGFDPAVFAGYETAALIKGGLPVASAPGPAFLFDTDDGRLLWDADGSGNGKALHVATLQGVRDLSFLNLTASQPVETDPGEVSLFDGEEFAGTPGDDMFEGTGLRDSFRGNGGSDFFYGHGGSDHFFFDRPSSPPTDRTDTIADFQTGIDKLVLETTGAFAALKTTAPQILTMNAGGAVPVTSGPTIIITEPYPVPTADLYWLGYVSYQADGFSAGENPLAAGNVITAFVGLSQSYLGDINPGDILIV
jgi:Ca2+-binding RTX toxin-like protein